MSKNPPSVQLQLNPSLFDATGRSAPRTVAAPPLWDPFGGAPPMSDADHDRWLDQQDERRQWALDARG